MSEWQQANFGSDLIIPPSDLTVSKNLPEQDAFSVISFWVREQGVVIGDRLIYVYTKVSV